MNNLSIIALIFVSLLATSCHTEYQQPDPNRTIYYEHNLTSIPETKDTTNPEEYTPSD